MTDEPIDITEVVPIEYVTLSCGNCSAIVPVTKCGPGPQIAACLACGTTYHIVILSQVLDTEDILLN